MRRPAIAPSARRAVDNPLLGLKLADRAKDGRRKEGAERAERADSKGLCERPVGAVWEEGKVLLDEAGVGLCAACCGLVVSGGAARLERLVGRVEDGGEPLAGVRDVGVRGNEELELACRLIVGG